MGRLLRALTITTAGAAALLALQAPVAQAQPLPAGAPDFDFDASIVGLQAVRGFVYAGNEWSLQAAEAETSGGADGTMIWARGGNQNGGSFGATGYGTTVYGMPDYSFSKADPALSFPGVGTVAGTAVAGHASGAGNVCGTTGTVFAGEASSSLGSLTLTPAGLPAVSVGGLSADVTARVEPNEVTATPSDKKLVELASVHVGQIRLLGGLVTINVPTDPQAMRVSGPQNAWAGWIHPPTLQVSFLGRTVTLGRLPGQQSSLVLPLLLGGWTISVGNLDPGSGYGSVLDVWNGAPSFRAEYKDLQIGHFSLWGDGTALTC